VKDGEKFKYHETSGKSNKKVSSGPEIYHLTSKNDIGFDRLAGVAGLVRGLFGYLPKKIWPKIRVMIMVVIISSNNE